MEKESDKTNADKSKGAMPGPTASAAEGDRKTVEKALNAQDDKKDKK